MSEAATHTTQAVAIVPQLSDGVLEFNGQQFVQNAKGDLRPVAKIKDADRLQDQTVRKIMQFALDLNAQLDRFRSNTMADLGAFDALLSEKYGAKIGGPKGNRTYQSYDGLLRIKVQMADLITFGPELQAAKSLIDECLTEWSEGSRPEIRAVVTRAFNTDKEGQINKAELFMLLNLKIEDDRWQRAMDAIRDSIRVTGSKEYVRFYRRARLADEWQAVTIDLAKAGA